MLIGIADFIYICLFAVIALFAFSTGDYLQCLAALAIGMYLHWINSDWGQSNHDN